MYGVLGYAVQRADEWLLLVIFLVLFALYFLQSGLIKIKQISIPKLNFKQILWTGVLLRVVFLFAMPNLSDDYFRFIWDGHLVLEGQNPYEKLPSECNYEDFKDWGYMYEEVYKGNSKTFPDGMNSKEYYSVYPPVNQLIFAASSAFSTESVWLNVIFLRLFIILFEVGVIIFLGRLLIRMKKNKNLVALYAFNPLVIVELTGNLHFEGVTLFFVLAAVWFLWRSKEIIAGGLFALAIGTKLIPILFLPFFLFKVPFKKLLIFYGVIGAALVLMFLPFTSVNLFETFGQSIQLYFKTFEFNASLYYIFREIGYWFTGYNQIEIIGRIGQVAVIVFAAFLLIKGRKEKRMKAVFEQLVWMLMVYYAFASIVHPWYVIYLVGLSVLTNLRFPILWSLLVVISYWAYRTTGVVDENLWLVAIEYAVLTIVIVMELISGLKDRFSLSAKE